MASGIFTAKERVVRDGRLVCFAGEKMTAAEAERRGLAKPAKGAKAPAPGALGTHEPDTVRAEADRMADLMAMSADALAELAADIGAKHAKGATKQVMAEAIVARERE